VNLSIQPTREPLSCARRVLVVEDDEDLRALVALGLRRRGHIVSEAESGSTALRALFDSTSELAPEVVVSDLRMPGLSGLSLLRLLREERWRGAFVLVTAFPEEADRKRARSLGAVVLSKPIDVLDLVDVVESTAELGPVSQGSPSSRHS
jgi:DNA-binding response OmpR family regulator